MSLTPIAPRAPLVVTEGLTKVYRMGEIDVPVLAGVDLTIDHGTVHAILGPSGCGKTTLLNLLGALDVPTSGQIVVDGVPLGGMSDAARTRYRQERIGFVFQFFNLMPLLTAIENVELGLEVLAGIDPKEVTERSAEMLRMVGLGDQMNKFPSQLSGGQQQRVAIARALVKRPPLVLCDEPTGNLDAKTSGAIVDLILDLREQHGTTFVVVTHSSELASTASRITTMLDGKVSGEVREKGSSSREPTLLRPRPYGRA